MTAKSAYAYKTLDFAVCLDGGTVVTYTLGGTIPTVTTLRVGDSDGGTLQPYRPISRVAYWNSRLPNATLQALTA